MSNFKVSFKILRKNLIMLLITLMLPMILMPMQLSMFDDTNQGFVNAKPYIYIVNKDTANDLKDEEKKELIKINKEEKENEINKTSNEEKKDKKITEEINETNVDEENKNITKHFLKYIYSNAIVSEFNQEGDKLNNILEDALYLDQISMIVEIPENFREDVLNKKNPEIKIKANSFGSADLSKMLIDKYMRNLSLINEGKISEEELITKLDKTLKTEVKTKMFEQNQSVPVKKAEFVFSFIAYSIVSAVLTIDLIILYYFRSEAIKKRIDISSEKEWVHKLKVFLSMCLVTSIITAIYILANYIFININVIKSFKGIFFGINAFIFAISIMSLAYLLINFVKTIGGATGLTVVIALTFSFISGAFVPREFLPDITVKISKIIPTYYYVDNVIIISEAHELSEKVLNEIYLNFGMLAIFAAAFAILGFVISKIKSLKKK